MITALASLIFPTPLLFLGTSLFESYLSYQLLTPNRLLIPFHPKMSSILRKKLRLEDES